ncbi:hypothetical protein G3I13_02010 [Streptomyces sp. SID6673]|nr:hypothetical protein [Streptomyces sp. SID11726]NDZ94937.1 hypothetical protein [Streptomyces sp. SID11726]NEB23096.1 hypothetical protein [Streptomyces sp. SID6673]
MATVEATSNITHDKQRYAAGDTFEVTDAQAEALVASGAAKKAAQEKTPVEVKADRPAETKAPETKAPEARDVGAAKKAAQSK